MGLSLSAEEMDVADTDVVTMHDVGRLLPTQRISVLNVPSKAPRPYCLPTTARGSTHDSMSVECHPYMLSAEALKRLLVANGVRFETVRTVPQEELVETVTLQRATSAASAAVGAAVTEPTLGRKV